MTLSDKAQATRERIVDTATRLFYLHGYNATGLDKIIKAAGVTKGNFYYYFASKEALALATLDWQLELTVGEIQNNILNQRLSPLEKLIALLESMSSRQKRQHKDGFICGCYFGNFSLELSTASQPVRDRVKHVFGAYIALIESLLIEAKAHNQIAEHIDPVLISPLILSQLEGATLIDKANQNPVTVDKSIEFIRRYLTT